jgi:hypothetical protein
LEPTGFREKIEAFEPRQGQKNFQEPLEKTEKDNQESTRNKK